MSIGSSDPCALGHSIWQKHTHIALNTGVHTPAREIGAAVYERHADFVASAWRRMSGRGAADDAGESRPVVIGRRIHVDRDAPESAMPATQPVARARLISQERSISRERARGGEHAAAASSRHGGGEAGAAAESTPDEPIGVSGVATESSGMIDDARPASDARTERIAGAPSPGSSTHRVESAPVARTGGPMQVMREGSSDAGNAGASGDSHEMVKAPPSPPEDAHKGGMASTVRMTGDIVDVRDVGNDGSRAPSTTPPTLVREPRPDRPLADTSTIRGLPAAHARGAGGSGKPKASGTASFAVMRAPAKTAPRSAGTTALHGREWQHASGAAALPAVFAHVPHVVSAQKPLVAALHRWLGDVGGAAGPATGPGILQPGAMTQRVDVAAAGHIRTSGDVVDVLDEGNNSSGAPSATPMRVREPRPDRPLADTSTIRGLPAAHARGADGSGTPKDAGAAPFAVMRAPARTASQSPGTTGLHDTESQHASGTAALPAVFGRVPCVASAPKPLVAALHRGLGNEGGAAGPVTGPGILEPRAMARSVDVSAAGRIDTSTRVEREARRDNVTPSSSISLRANAAGDGTSRTPAAEARFDGKVMREAGAPMRGEGARSATDGPDVHCDVVDAEHAQRALNATAMPVAAALAGGESARVARSEAVAIALLAEPSPADRTVVRVTDANARSIAQWLRDTKVSAGERAPAVRREADSTVVPRAATTTTRTANDTGPSVAPVIASPGVRAAGHCGVQSDVGGSVARPSMADTSVHIPVVLAHEPAHSQAASTLGIARHASTAPVQTVSAAQALYPARTGSEAPPVGTASAYGPSFREIRADSASPLATASHGKVAMALTPGSAQAHGYALRASPSSEGHTVQRGDAGAHPVSVALPRDRIARDFAVAPAHAGELSTPAFDGELVAPFAHATAAQRGDTRMPGFLRVFASAGPVAARAAGVPEAAQSQPAFVMSGSGVHAQQGAAAWPGVSRSEAAASSQVERLADEYGVVPAAIQRAVTPPDARPAVPPASPGAPHAGDRADDVNELAERAWQIIQDRLASERERRGYGSWP